MSITNMTITQDNKTGDSNLMAVHSPLVFLVEVDYTGPDVRYIYVDVKDKDDVVLATFKCIPYRDLTSTRRLFLFKAESILQGYMDEYFDFAQTNNSLDPVEGITEKFTLEFRDPDAIATPVSTTIMACHGARQFGQDPNMSDQYNNDTENIYVEKGKECYVYFYNDDENNVISVGAGYEVRFTILEDDGVTPIQDAKITINGTSLFTDSNGQVSFFLTAATYNYEIYKEGYQSKTGSFTVTSSALYFTVELIAEVQSVVTFHVEYSSTDIENAFIEVYRSGELIDSGYTDSNGDWVSNLYQDTYDIQVSELDFPLKVDNFQAVINTDPQTVNVVVTEIPTYQINITVQDSTSGLPIQGAKIGNDTYATSEDPNDTWRNQTAILTTDINGEVQVYDVPATDLVGIVKSGYASAVYTAHTGPGTTFLVFSLLSNP